MILLALIAAEFLQVIPAVSAYADGKGDTLRNPEGVACTADGYVVAADSGNGRLVTWQYKDGALSGGAVIRFAELGYPVRVQIDSRGNVLSLDRKTRRIVRVSPDGKFAGVVSFKGVPAQRGFFPVSFKLDKADNVYALDVMSDRVVVADAGGAFVRQIATPAQAQLTDIAVDSRGTVFAADGPRAVLYAAGPDENALTQLGTSLKEYMSYPTYLAATEGPLVVVDGHGMGLVVAGRDGAFLGRRLSIGWSEGLVYYPGQICIDGKGDVFVADRGNQRIQAFGAAK